MCTAVTSCDGFSHGDDEPCKLMEAVSDGSPNADYKSINNYPKPLGHVRKYASSSGPLSYLLCVHSDTWSVPDIKIFKKNIFA